MGTANWHRYIPSCEDLERSEAGRCITHLAICIVTAAVISKTESDCESGYSIGGHLLSNLTYADDIAAINSTQSQLQDFLDCIVNYSAEVGLHMNVSKTECMTTAKNCDLRITINGKQIKQVTEFFYLGHKLSCTNDGTAAVKHRIGLGWAAFENNKTIHCRIKSYALGTFFPTLQALTKLQKSKEKLRKKKALRTNGWTNRG